MTRLPSRYVPLHALAAGAVLFCAVGKNFVHNFLHGVLASPPPVAALMLMLALQTALFGFLALALWASTLFPWSPRAEDENPPPPKRRAALKFTLFAFPGICLVTFGAEWISTFVCEHLFGLTFPPQEIVGWLKPGVYPLWARLVLIAFVLVEAPLVEEPLFRGIVFRGLLKWNHLWAFVVSGLLFALIHVNAATALPLFYLGVSFAWLYWKTRTILAPMLAHFLFNLANLVVCLLTA